jgi:phospho-N-acetylmuramoyl-pentapeptide-transferase
LLYHFLYPLNDFFSVLNVFRYITFRTALAAVTSFALSLLIGKWLIRTLKKKGMVHEPRREDCPDLYGDAPEKAQTPTMGGLIILTAVIGSVVLWADLANDHIFILVVVTLCMGLLGLYDDVMKVRRNAPRGVSGRAKLLAQVLLATGLGFFLFLDPLRDTTLDIPFVKQSLVQLSWFYIPFTVLVLVGSTNAVNLTDGLDGLAIGCVTLTAIAYAILSYVTGHMQLAHYLGIPYIIGSGEVAVFCGALIGAGLGFLWFNAHPAEVFMGDTGALALGGAIGTVALLIKKELLLVIVGGIFVAEALSVLLQVGSFRLRGKRIFKTAPLHHHFQLMGLAESKVVVRFWIIAVILVFISLATLKLR